ncbi:MAG: hypothetical protein J6A26_05910 [Oscillospiraceae bacterium]|nr:hypothetical protein [Oscillospiraceae bacterium]
MLMQAWNNGRFISNGSGYGVKVSEQFRDEYLSVDWASIFLHLEGEEEPVELAINNSVFWSKGRELRSGKIGKWLIKNGLAEFDLENPPELHVSPMEKNHFKVSL